MEHYMRKQCKSVLYPKEKNVVQVRGMNGVMKATGVTVVKRLTAVTGDDMDDRGIGGNGSEIIGEDKG